MPPSSDRNKPNRTLSPHSPSPSPMHSHGAQTSSPLAMSLGASAAGTAGAASAGFAGQLEIRSPPIQSPHTLEYSPSLYAHPGFLEQDTAGWLDPRPHFPHFARVPFSSPYSTLPSSSAFTVEDQRRSSKLNVSSSFYHSAFSVDPFMVMSGLRIPSRGDFISLSLLPLPPPPPSSPPPLPPPQSPPPQSPPPQSSSSSSLGKSAVKGQTNVPEFNQSYLDVPFNAMYYPSTEVLEEMEFSNTDLNDAMLPSSLNELLTPTELQQRQSRHHPQYMSHAWAYCDSHSPGTDERDERDEREEREERDEKVNMPQSQTDTTERRIDILGLELLHNYRPSLAAYPVAMAQGSLNPMRSRNQPSTWTLFPHDKFSEEEEEEEEEEDIFFHTMKIASAINIPKGSSDIANTAMSPQSIQSMYLGKDQEKNRQPMLSSAFSPFSSGEDDASFYMDDAEMGKSASVKTHDPHKGQGMSPHKSNFICPPWVGLPKLS
ncbi:hypothetical protein BDF14DRAFT_1006946 [Spinellus fusiger]|nr:hypothetical protein BDF14DRAFT_1006946 [Spinellus fusiger]